MKNKVYIVTGGTYSDYSIYAVFSDKEKAKEYIKNKLKIEESYDCLYDKDYFKIEVWHIDENIEIAEEIELEMTFRYNDIGNIEIIKIENEIYSEFEAEIKEKITYDEIFMRIEDKTISTSTVGKLRVTRKKNNNKDNESEIERIKKIGYDTIKRIKYIKEVLGINDTEEINNMINKN